MPLTNMGHNKIKYSNMLSRTAQVIHNSNIVTSRVQEKWLMRQRCHRTNKLCNRRMYCEECFQRKLSGKIRVFTPVSSSLRNGAPASGNWEQTVHVCLTPLRRKSQVSRCKVYLYSLKLFLLFIFYLKRIKEYAMINCSKATYYTNKTDWRSFEIDMPRQD